MTADVMTVRFMLLESTRSVTSWRVERERGVPPLAATASVSTLWWRAKDIGGPESPWNAFVSPPASADPIDQDLKFFENNVIRWPDKMPPPYKPVKSKENKKNAAIMKRLEELLPKPEQEVY